MKIRGLVLAGGRSSRFGSDKALATHGGRTFLETAVSLVERAGLRATVSVRAGAEYPFLRCPSVPDKLPDVGPLGGLYSAFSVFPDTSFLTLSCDMPELTPEALWGLLRAHRGRTDATVWHVDDRGIQPFPGIYAPSAMGVLRARLKSGDYSMRGFLEALPAAQAIDWEGDASEFRNRNVPAPEEVAKGRF